MTESIETVDARGLPCPQPVILTRRALQAHAQVVTIVDNEASQHNVTRMAEKAGYRVEVEQHADGIYVQIGGQEACAELQTEPVAQPAAAGPLALVASSEFMGRGEHDELGQILVRAFLHTLGEVEPTPDTIVLFNSGVKLAVEGSPVLEDLQALGNGGIEILACGTCLDYYGLKERLAVGQVSNMYTIAETMLRAGKVVHL